MIYLHQVRFTFIRYALPSSDTVYLHQVRFTFTRYVLPSSGTLYLHQVRFTFTRGKMYLVKVKHTW
jgi:hypothetical protein